MINRTSLSLRRIIRKPAFNNLHYKLLITVLICSCTSLYGQHQKSFIANGNKVNTTNFDGEINRMIDDVGIPAISLAIIENNKVVYTKAYGYKDQKEGNKATTETIFEACSLSKIFLVFVVQELVEKGLLDLNKPLCEYLSHEPLAYDDRYRSITAQMVLSHTSGIENWKDNNDKDKLEILAKPGSKFVYSGEGYQYLAKVVEKLLNEPYDSYIQHRIITPLQLKSTFLSYATNPVDSAQGKFPTNYAIGHTEFGEPVEKWKNLSPVPASGTHTTAADYAKFITTLFDGKYISDSTLSKMMKPVVEMKEGDSAIWTCGGFFVLYTKNDTIAFFNGINNGFKSEVFYSVKHKRGFVFFTNSDRGELAAGYLAQLTGLDLHSLFSTSFHSVYPSQAIDLFKAYRLGKETALFKEIETLKQSEGIKPNTLDELGDIFMSSKPEIAQKVLEQNIVLYPASSLSHCLLGGIYYQKKDYENAYIHLTKAQELHFDLWDISGPLNEVSNYMNEIKKKK